MGLTGCKPAASPQVNPAQQPSQGAGIVDTMTQKSKTNAGRCTADKVRQIGAEQQRDLEQVMGEQSHAAPHNASSTAPSVSESDA